MGAKETGVSERQAETDQLKIDYSSRGILSIGMTGNWRLGDRPPSALRVDELLKDHPDIDEIIVDGRDLSEWDSSLLTFLSRLYRTAEGKGIKIRSEGLPEGSKRLLERARSVSGQAAFRKKGRGEGLLSVIGSKTLKLGTSTKQTFEFIGEVFLALIRLVLGRASFRKADLGLFLQQTGAQALPIVSLISALVGLILAFVGAVQLRAFGAQIYVADLVGIGMVRVMGAIMAGIIMAGRTGASYAAQIGTMQVNEEVDALKTLGVSPIEFLVLPRVLALMIMMPLLTAYADIMGVLGGLIVGVVVLDIHPIVYLNQTKNALSLTNVWIGLFHGAVFGILIGIAGCLRGMQCSRSAQGVGNATTSAVVTAIVAIIVATAIITVVCNILGI